jgi:hypothetical protein
MLAGLTVGSTALLLVLQIVDPRSFEALLTHDAEGVLVRRGVDLTAGSLFLVASADLRPAEAALTSLVGLIFLGLGIWGARGA